MKTLPVELQTRYVALLSPKSLSSFCLVSRSMCNIAFPLLHRSLVLSPRSIGALARRIISENEQKPSSLHGLRITDHVRELTFLHSRRRRSPGIDRAELSLAAEALPYLKNVIHLRWLETITDDDSNQYAEPEFSTFVQTARDVFGEKLQTLEIYFQGDSEDHTYSVESASRIPLFTFPHLKQLRIGSHSWKSGVSARGAFLDMGTYYEPFCNNLEELSPCLEVLDFSTTFHTDSDIIGNFFSSLEGAIHFPRLRELHIRSPFNDDEGCDEGSTPLLSFINRHAAQLTALSLPCPIEDFDNDYLYEPLELPCLPNLTKLDAPVLWVNMLTDRELVPKLEDLKVWLSLPKEDCSEHRSQETSKEELEPLLARLVNVHSLRVLDLCQSSIEFDVELVGMLTAACPSLEWLGILILEPETNWSATVSSLSQLGSLHTLRTPDVPHVAWDSKIQVVAPSEATHDAALALAKVCPVVSRLESFVLQGESLSHGCPSVQSLWKFHRGTHDTKADYTFYNIPSVDVPWNNLDPAY